MTQAPVHGPGLSMVQITSHASREECALRGPHKLVLARDVKAGEVVLEEDALVWCRQGEDARSVLARLFEKHKGGKGSISQRLTAQRECLLALAIRAHQLAMSTPSSEKNVLKWLADQQLTMESSVLSKHDQHVAQLLAHLTGLDLRTQAVPLVLRLHCYAHVVTSSTSFQPCGLALHRVFTKGNHSCVPSCSFAFLLLSPSGVGGADEQRLRCRVHVRANCNMKSGEEITYLYDQSLALRCQGQPKASLTRPPPAIKHTCDGDGKLEASSERTATIVPLSVLPHYRFQCTCDFCRAQATGGAGGKPRVSAQGFSRGVDDILLCNVGVGASGLLKSRARLRVNALSMELANLLRPITEGDWEASADSSARTPHEGKSTVGAKLNHHQLLVQHVSQMMVTLAACAPVYQTPAREHVVQDKDQDKVDAESKTSAKKAVPLPSKVKQYWIGVFESMLVRFYACKMLLVAPLIVTQMDNAALLDVITIGVRLLSHRRPTQHLLVERALVVSLGLLLSEALLRRAESLGMDRVLYAVSVGESLLTMDAGAGMDSARRFARRLFKQIARRFVMWPTGARDFDATFNAGVCTLAQDCLRAHGSLQHKKSGVVT